MKFSLYSKLLFKVSTFEVRVNFLVGSQRLHFLKRHWIRYKMRIKFFLLPENNFSLIVLLISIPVRVWV